MWRRQPDARALYDRGSESYAKGRLDDAERAFRASLELDGNAPAVWFDLGLVYKRWHRWPDVLRCDRRALELDPTGRAAAWNMGIAATAVGDWEAARAGWKAAGIEMPDGVGPADLGWGLTAIRLHPEGAAEVVWATRLDPARGRIESVPLPDTGHRWGDVVLHDGEPKGERVHGGKTYIVFDALERLQASDVPTLDARIVAPDESDSDALTELFDANGYAAEDWTASVVFLCKTCSEGRPDASHHHDEGPWRSERRFGIGAPADVAEALLARWAGSSPGRRYDNVEQIG